MSLNFSPVTIINLQNFSGLFLFKRIKSGVLPASTIWI